MFRDLIKWSHKNFSELPWRHGRTLYTTLVSEIMLQQTTVNTVINHYHAFLEKFPDIENLASVQEEEVLAAWKGLGYYRRARNLHKAAVQICERFDGKIPRDFDELVSINGIGEYTASAIISIGADLPALSVDANLERVLSRIYGIEEFKGPKLQKLIRKKFEEGSIVKDIEKFGPRDLNEAFMDLGRTICQANKVECNKCPMSEHCVAFKTNRELALPLVEEKKKSKENFDLELVRFVVKNGEKILGYEKDSTEWLTGQIEIPTFILSSQDKTLAQYPILKTELPLQKGLKKIKTGITKYRITNYIYPCNLKEFQQLTKGGDRYKFYSQDGQSHHFSTTTLKVFERIK